MARPSAHSMSIPPTSTAAICRPYFLERTGQSFRNLQHVLVSDIGMPNQDGYGLIRQVRALGTAKGGDMPAIALTAYISAADRSAALQAGFTVHLSKPVRSSDLLAALHNVTLGIRR